MITISLRKKSCLDSPKFQQNILEFVIWATPQPRNRLHCTTRGQSCKSEATMCLQSILLKYNFWGQYLMFSIRLLAKMGATITEALEKPNNWCRSTRLSSNQHVRVTQELQGHWLRVWVSVSSQQPKHTFPFNKSRDFLFPPPKKHRTCEETVTGDRGNRLYITKRN